MVGTPASWLIALALLAAHIALAFGLNAYVHWLYFEAGVTWGDPVVPQLQGLLSLIGQIGSALIFVPAGVLASRQRRGGVLLAVAWPLIFAALPFLAPHILAWLGMAAILQIVGIIILVRLPLKAPA